jgi:hypothetical protein
MTIKTSGPLEAVPDTSLSAQQPVAASQFSSGTQLSPHDRISQLGFDGFQVALVRSDSAHAGIQRTFISDWNPREFLVLPLTWRELMAQVRKEVGHPAAPPRSTTARFGDVSIDWDSMEVRRCHHLVRLTPLEFKVLKFFVANPSRVISRDDLLDQVWGYENYPCTRTVDNHILRLRQKLEPDFAHPVHFETIHGIGYKFNP